jgi:hypothetical protein
MDSVTLGNSTPSVASVASVASVCNSTPRGWEMLEGCMVNDFSHSDKVLRLYGYGYGCAVKDATVVLDFFARTPCDR